VKVLHGNMARGMVMSNPEMALQPWPAYKNFNPKIWEFLPDTGLVFGFA
jgi:hypothetical protein